MKKWFNIFFVIGLSSLLITGCKKDETRLMFDGANTVTLTSSATTLNLVAADSLTEAVKFSWTDPNYQIGGSRASYKVTYTLEIDTSGGTFVKPIVATVEDKFELKFTVKEFNALLVKYGLKAGKTYSLVTRLASNFYWNESRATSNAVNVSATPYSVKPTPKWEVPNSLFIVGGATAGGWGNPVPVPTQQLTKIDEFTFGIVVQLTAGDFYLLLPNNGSWDHKFAIADKTNPAFQTGGDLIKDGGEDIPAPAASGLYKIIVNFITGSYAVTPATAADMAPASLFIVGDATPGGWNNPVPVPSQQFTRTSAGGYEIIVALTPAKFYLLLPTNGSWDHKYAVVDKTSPEAKEGGTFLVDAGQDIPSPDESGNYKIEVEFITRTYRVTRQ
jgi:starch-binding outer membrane protein SusE/F